MATTDPADRLSPVTLDLDDSKPQRGIALCLSGGGYRSMVFHLGSLWRLNELGYLHKIDQISAVSGGAATAALLGLRFFRLSFAGDGVARAFQSQVVEPIRELTSVSIDAAAVIGGVLSPGASVSDKLLDAFRTHLFQDATLQDLPDRPRVVINATNVQSGALWSFSREAMSDPRVGTARNPTVPLAVAVAASAAVPPFFSPVRVELDATEFDADSGQELHCTPYTTEVVLTNGGFLDKLALETAWPRYDTILVSDGGPRFREEPEPKLDLVRHSQRILGLLDCTARRARKKRLIEALRHEVRQGAYWSLRSDIDAFELGDAMSYPVEKTRDLASHSGRLKRLDRRTQDRLINWGYAACDAALRKHVDQKLPGPTQLPFPEPDVSGG